MKRTTDGSPWFRNYRPAPQAPVRLFALPHAGGSASYFHPLASVLSPAVDVYGVQYPGRQDRRSEPGETSLERLADRITAELLPLDDGRPYALFGHSMGAMLAFEVARRTEAAGQGPAHLFVSGRPAPCQDSYEAWFPRTDEEVVRELRALNATDDGLLDDPEVRRMLLPPLRTDYRAVREYRFAPGPPLRTPITALTGDADPMAEVGKVDAWRAHTRAAFGLWVLPGGHFYLNDRLDEVAAAVADALPAAAPAAVAA